MKKYLILLLFLILLISCKKEKEFVQDNATKNLPINPVVEIKKENISKGNKLFLNGNYEEALKYYEKGVKENKSVAYYNIGVSYFLLGNLAESEKYFKLAIKDDPQFKEAYINLVAVLVNEGKADEAEKYIKIIEKYDDLKTYINLANLYLLKGSTAKSYYYFQKALDKGKDNDFVKSSFGSFLISINKIDQGIKYLLEIKNKGYDEYFNLAKAFYYKKDYKQSINFIKQAIEIKKTENALKLLADNYNAINDYILEASILSELIELKNRPEYRYRFSLALFKSGDFSKAKEVINSLINQYPFEGKYYKLKYDILINEQKYVEAKNVLAVAYKRINTSFFKYLYVKHLLLYFNDYKSAEKLIKRAKATNDYDYLAYAVYYAKVKQFDKMISALSKINKKDSEYYFLYSYYFIVKGDYKTALKYIDKMSVYENRYYIYKFVSLWNLADLDGLIKLSKLRIDYLKYNRQKPDISFKIKANVYDIGFLYRYDDNFEDVLRLFLVPLIIDPNESVEFLVLGYKLLQDKENIKAINELKKSANFNEGIYYNNKGVEAYLSFKFYDAIKNFKIAAKLLKNNPIINYNLGLSYLNLGDLKRAYSYFDSALLNNKFILYAYLGKAVIFHLEGKISRISTQYDLVLNNYDISKDKLEYPQIFKYAKYLAEIGLGKYDEVIFEVANSNHDFLYETFMGKLAQFFKEREKTFDVDKFKNIYNFVCFNDLINGNLSFNGNRVCDHYKAYKRVKSNDVNFSPNFKKDKYEIAQNTMYFVALNKLKDTFKNLQVLSRKDFRYPKLYEISFYYFLLIRDFINAEASYTTLEKLKHSNLYTQYYRMLYFLLNYNEKRLIKEINKFIKDYPVDYKGLMVDALFSFKNNNLKKILDDLISIKSITPDAEQRWSLEILLNDL